MRWTARCLPLFQNWIRPISPLSRQSWPKTPGAWRKLIKRSNALILPFCRINRKPFLLIAEPASFLPLRCSRNQFLPGFHSAHTSNADWLAFQKKFTINSAIGTGFPERHSLMLYAAGARPQETEVPVSRITKSSLGLNFSVRRFIVFRYMEFLRVSCAERTPYYRLNR